MVRPHRAQLSLERATTIWFGVTVVIFTLGSATFSTLKSDAGRAKWFALVVLFALAVALAWQRRPFLITGLHRIVAVLLALMAVSATWSVAPVTTAKHALALLFMLGTAGALASAASVRAPLVRELGVALGVAATVICLAGLLTLVADPSAALLRGTPTRLRGITENPDTAPLLLVLALPFLVLASVESRGRGRALWAAAVLLCFGTLIATVSRGGWIAAFAGSVILVALVSGRRARLVTVVAVVACWGVAASLEVAANARSAAQIAAPVSDWRSGYPAWQGYVGPLGEELYPTESGGWSLLGTSGRAGAWRGTIRQAARRPILGYGFGTESIVFFDRYYNFQGGSSEDSYVGMLLQLGAIGLALLLAALAAALVAARRALRAHRRLAVTLAAALTAGVLLAISQSYLYAAGNLAALPFWVLAFAAAGLAVRETDARV